MKTKNIIFILLAFSFVLTFSCKDEDPVILVTDVTLNKTSLTLVEGEKEILRASVFPENATNTRVKWKSANSAIASVDSDGEVTTHKPGSTTITVTTEDGHKSATCNVTVEAKTVAVSGVTLNKTSLTIVEGESEILSATVLPEDATDKAVNWLTDNESVATVDSDGKVTAINKGSAIITVSTKDGNKRATCEVVVEPKIVSVTAIELNKTSVTLTEGESEVLKVTVLPEDASNKNVKWKSSDHSVATVSTEGKITALEEGSTTITVKTQDGDKTASCEVIIKAKTISVTNVALNLANTKIEEGKSLSLEATVYPENATNKNVTWKSSNSSIASVDANGNVTALKTGNVIITVTTVDGNKTASCEVEIEAKHIPVSNISLSETSLVLVDGDSETLTATVLPNDATNKSVRWISSDKQVATVNNGVITTISPGHTTITVTTNDGNYSATCLLEVQTNKIPSKWDGYSYSQAWINRGNNGIYRIKNAAELAGFSKCFSQGYYTHGNFNGATVYLDRDIDLGEYEWTPIGTMINNTYYSFAGTFDGNNHKIKGLKVTKLNNSTSVQVAGLFGIGFTDGFSVKNVSVEGEIMVDATSNLFGALYVGGIAGFVQSSSTIENCHSNVNIYSNATTGNNINVMSGGIVGQIISDMTEPLKKCSSRGEISASLNSSNSGRIGGIVGQINKGKLLICSSSSRIHATGGKSIDIGGIAGLTSGVNASDLLYSGDINVYSPYHAFVAGLIGVPSGSMELSNSLMIGYYYKTGGTAYLSALVGTQSESTKVSNSFYRSGLNTGTSYGTSITESVLKSGSVIQGFSTSIWRFTPGSYPYLVFD